MCVPGRGTASGGDSSPFPMSDGERSACGWTFSQGRVSAESTRRTPWSGVSEPGQFVAVCHCGWEYAWGAEASWRDHPVSMCLHGRAQKLEREALAVVVSFYVTRCHLTCLSRMYPCFLPSRADNYNYLVCPLNHCPELIYSRVRVWVYTRQRWSLLHNSWRAPRRLGIVRAAGGFRSPPPPVLTRHPDIVAKNGKKVRWLIQSSFRNILGKFSQVKIEVTRGQIFSKTA